MLKPVGYGVAAEIAHKRNVRELLLHVDAVHSLLLLHVDAGADVVDSELAVHAHALAGKPLLKAGVQLGGKQTVEVGVGAVDADQNPPAASHKAVDGGKMLRTDAVGWRHNGQSCNAVER